MKEMQFQKEVIKECLSRGWYCEKVIAEGKNGRPDLNVRKFPFSSDMECKWIKKRDLKSKFGSVFQPGQLTTYIEWLEKGSGEIHLLFAFEDGGFGLGVLLSKDQILTVKEMTVDEAIKPIAMSIKELVDAVFFRIIESVKIAKVKFD